MKVVDCFMFYNELKMLEFRLRLLYDVVDYFVLVESEHTHAGNTKQLHFKDNKDTYSKYLDKIVHVVVSDMPNNGNPWANENHQRRCIDRGIQRIQLSDNDIVLISDLDEIPNNQMLKAMRTHERAVKGVYSLVQDLYYYNLECQVHEKWDYAKLLDYSSYKKCRRDCNRIRGGMGKTRKLLGGGWHFSYFGDIEFIKNKIKNFGHQEFNNAKYLDSTKLEKQIKDCNDLFLGIKQNSKKSKLKITRTCQTATSSCCKAFNKNDSMI